MEKFQGRTVYEGIGIGRIHMLKKKKSLVVRRQVEDTQQEVKLYEAARTAALKQLEELYTDARSKIGEENAGIFEMHQMLLEDGEYNSYIEKMITEQHLNAEYAIAATGDYYVEMFANMEDAYLKERSVDVSDITQRMIDNIHRGNAVQNVVDSHEEEKALDTKENVIVISEELTPSQTIQMDTSKVQAFVTRYGSNNSHTAIIARTLGIPALVQVEVDNQWDGTMAIVDGDQGLLIIDPDEETIKQYCARQKADKERQHLLEALKGQGNVTKSGKHIEVFANIGNLKDLDLAEKNDAGGIGLFRSEFLYMGKREMPTEEEQFQIYREVVQKMKNKTVIIRTLDIGADKQLDYLQLEKEENPALGCRAIRLCLERPELFKTQLRALYRTSVYGNISIMYPMITSEEELLEIEQITKEVKESLKRDNLPFQDLKTGIMIETPAAALISDLLAKHADFFSIGTNDLSQYTMALDRENANLDRFYQSHHPAVMRLIKMVIENAHAAGIPVGICGELGADTSMTEQFLAWGVDELSVSPACVLPLRKAIRELD